MVPIAKRLGKTPEQTIVRNMPLYQAAREAAIRLGLITERSKS